MDELKNAKHERIMNMSPEETVTSSLIVFFFNLNIETFVCSSGLHSIVLIIVVTFVMWHIMKKNHSHQNCCLHSSPILYTEFAYKSRLLGLYDCYSPLSRFVFFQFFLA